MTTNGKPGNVPTPSQWRADVADRKRRAAALAEAERAARARAQEMADRAAAQVVAELFAGMIRDGADPWGDARYVLLTEEDMRKAFTFYDSEADPLPRPVGTTRLTAAVCGHAAHLLAAWNASTETYLNVHGSECACVMVPHPDMPPTEGDYEHVRRPRMVLAER